MPILVPAPTPTVTPSTTRAVPTRPTLTLSRGGTALVLSLANGWVILPGVEGFDGPPPALIDVEPATWDGSLPVAARYAAREVFLPLNYAADSTEALRDTTRALAVLTDIKRGGMVTLEVAHADGTRRWTEGRLSAPFGTALAMAEAGLWRQFGLTLRCGDPFWLGKNRSETFVVGGSVPEFLSDEFLPIQLADSQVVGSINIINYGDTDAYPVWTLTGPFDDATVTLDGLVWAVPDGLTDTEVLTIDTRRGVQSVMVNESAAWGRLAPGAQLGPLPPGGSHVDVTVTGATSATTLTVVWRERWLTAW
jgi:hypothetical protein